MPTFEYKAMDLSGQTVAGLLAGASEQAVLNELEARKLVPVVICEAKERRGFLKRRVSTRALAMSYTQLSDLLKAGVPILRGLKLLGNRKSQPGLSAVFRELADAVSEGKDLADAMAARPDVFAKVHIAMIRAGEKGGFLESVLERLGTFVMGQAELRGKIIGNMVYPAMLVVFGTVVLLVVFGIFVPMFEPMFERLPQLPAVTKLVFGASALVGTYGPVTLVLGIIGTIGGWRMSKRPAVRRKLTEIRTYMPVLGPLTRSLAAGRFCRMLGTMLTNGIPMLSAMQIAKEASGNILMEEAIDQATEAVRAGEDLSPPLAQSGLFTDDVIEMITVAESANNLDVVLITIAGTIETRVDRLLNAAVRLIEPLLLMALAVVIVIVAAGLLLPMTQLSGAI